MFNALVVSWFLTFGYVPMQDTAMNGKMETLQKGSFSTVSELGIRADFYRLSVYGSVETFQRLNENNYFSPFRAEYRAGAALKITEWCTLVAEHECIHPVQSDVNNRIGTSFMSQETQIKVVFSGRSK